MISQDELIKKIKSDYRNRRWAAEQLGKIGDARTVEPLCRALTGAYDYVAVEVLGRIGAAAVEPLCRALADADKDVRDIAAKALGKIGDARSVEPLCRALGDADQDVRRHVAEALEKIGDARAVEPLCRALGDPNGLNARSGGAWPETHSVAEALGKIGDTRAVEPLCRALGVREIARGNALASLLANGDANVATTVVRMGAEAVGPLCAALGDLSGGYDDNRKNCSSRTQAAVALGLIGDSRAVGTLVSALERDFDEVRKEAARALVKIDNAVAPLSKALWDENYPGRRYITEALSEIGAPAAAALRKALSDTEVDLDSVEGRRKALGDVRPSVREAAVKVLEKIGDANSMDLLFRALGDENETICRKAAIALAGFRAAAGEPLCVALLTDKNERTRSWAAFALGVNRDPRAVVPLCSALGEKIDDVRIHAAGALNSFTIHNILKVGGSAVDPLCAALTDTNDAVRIEAAEALRRIADARAVEPLCRALRDRNKRVRQEAAGALCRVGDARAVEPLIGALGDPEECNVRSHAAEALQRIGDPRAVEPLCSLLKDTDVGVRWSAARALKKLGVPQRVAALCYEIISEEEAAHRRADHGSRYGDG
jgi:HEAT repeat protein